LFRGLWASQRCHVLKLYRAAQMSGHFLESFDEIVADARARASTRFDAHARLSLARSF